MIKPGMLVQYYDKPALVIRAASLDDCISLWGNSFRLGNYWVILLGEKLYVVGQEVLGEIKL